MMPMRLSHRFRLAMTAGALAFVAASGAEAARNADAGATGAVSFAGSYLAGRSADRARDTHAAARYYGDALSTDPANPALLERVLLLSLANGDMDDAFDFAERLVVYDDSNPPARVSRAVKAIKDGGITTAVANLEKIDQGELSLLTTGLIRAWI